MLKTIDVPNHIFLEEVRQHLREGHTTTFRVRGWSMRPFLENGRDKVLLVSPQKRPVRVGEVALVLTTDNRYVLHRVVAMDAEGGCTLWGDGNVRGQETCTADNVIGVAEGFYLGRKERYLSMDSRLWRTYSWFWMHTTWLRRWMLLFYRVCFKLTVLFSWKKRH